jgi:B-cell receptor-associated protein 31
MIQLLFTLVLAEMAVILTLMFRTPVRKLVMMGLERSKQGRGPLVAKTVAGTMMVLFSSTVYSVMKIRKRSTEAGMLNPTDEVLMARRHLEASLVGTKPLNTIINLLLRVAICLQLIQYLCSRRLSIC